MLEANPPAGPAADTDSDAILGFLTARQHLHPHASLADALDQAMQRFGCCPLAVARALEWLKLDGEATIGRLRRSELVQLARVIHRFWSQASAEPSSASR